MSHRARASLALAAIVAILTVAAPAASASVSLVTTFTASGFALGDTHLRQQVHVGTYSSFTQIGSGSYRFDLTYTPGGCTDATYTGTAVFTRTGGATLSGTVTGTSQCFDSPFHGGPHVDA
jgi:hypothetical protein